MMMSDIVELPEFHNVLNDTIKSTDRLRSDRKFYQIEAFYRFEFITNRLIILTLRNQITDESEFRSRVEFLIGCLLLQLRYPTDSTQ